MKILRYKTRTESATFGWLLDDRVGAINGDPFGSYRRLEASLPIEHIKLLTPILPSKIIAIKQNFLKTQAENSQEPVPEFPQIFLKPSSSIIGNNRQIEIPPQSNKVSFSVEIAIVIGKKGRWVPLPKANDYIFGYTCCINFFAQDILDRHPAELTRSYGFDTFTVLGPWIDTEYSVDDLLISSYINDQLFQLIPTHEMIFSIPQLVSFASSFMTLVPGDVLLTGGVPYDGSVKIDDIIRVEIGNLGTLQTIVAQSKAI